MLKSLHIENIAVIEKIDIEFSSGFNILTGETGAGKSIIIDSIGAIIGDRVTKSIVRNGADIGSVTAVFDCAPASEWLLQNEIECEDELIISRKISSEGKNSCRVNGIPVTMGQLRDLGSYLIDIHGQNDGRRLADEKNHLFFLDNFCTEKSYVQNFKVEYNKYVEIKKKLDNLIVDDKEKMLILDSLRLRVDEIRRANLKIGEEIELTERRNLLKNSEKLSEFLSSSYNLLYDNDESAISFLQNSEYYISKASQISPQFEEALNSISDAIFQIKNASELIKDFLNNLEFSEEEYNALESRLSLINRLERKYYTDESGLVELLEESEKKLHELEFSDELISILKSDFEKQSKKCLEAAQNLSNYRRKQATILEKRIQSELMDLNMKSVRFAVDFTPISDSMGFNSRGIDDVCFLMSANKGEKLGKINKIASGGELSRIMLAMKNVFAENDPVSTMIFDEIDTGVSGVAAQRVAEKLFNVSKGKQVMCVTHLPQLAAMGDTHFVISKSESDNRTYTTVRQVNYEGRKAELARLFGGDLKSETAMNTAEEILDLASAYKENN